MHPSPFERQRLERRRPHQGGRSKGGSRVRQHLPSAVPRCSEVAREAEVQELRLREGESVWQRRAPVPQGGARLGRSDAAAGDVRRVLLPDLRRPDVAPRALPHQAAHHGPVVAPLEAQLLDRESRATIVLLSRAPHRAVLGVRRQDRRRAPPAHCDGHAYLQPSVAHVEHRHADLAAQRAAAPRAGGDLLHAPPSAEPGRPRVRS
mmetsp:Transcript_35005/g.88195  ORF Transcript_35005/g.88195 Transcript_35005/m.88195 type:complete len:206 (+) Transcript_35005:681-1298(+)